MVWSSCLVSSLVEWVLSQASFILWLLRRVLLYLLSLKASEQGPRPLHYRAWALCYIGHYNGQSNYTHHSNELFITNFSEPPRTIWRGISCASYTSPTKPVQSGQSVTGGYSHSTHTTSRYLSICKAVDSLLQVLRFFWTFGIVGTRY